MGLKIDKEEYINRTFRLNKDIVEQMNKICSEKGISMNKLVDIFIRYSLEHLEDSN